MKTSIPDDYGYPVSQDNAAVAVTEVKELAVVFCSCLMAHGQNLKLL